MTRGSILVCPTVKVTTSCHVICFKPSKHVCYRNRLMFSWWFLPWLHRVTFWWFLAACVSECEVQFRGCLLLADACAGVDTDSAVQQRRKQVMKALGDKKLDVAVAPSWWCMFLESLILWHVIPHDKRFTYYKPLGLYLFLHGLAHWMMFFTVLLWNLESWQEVKKHSSPHLPPSFAIPPVCFSELNFQNRQDLSTCFALSYRKITSTLLPSIALVADFFVGDRACVSATIVQPWPFPKTA